MENFFNYLIDLSKKIKLIILKIVFSTIIYTLCIHTPIFFITMLTYQFQTYVKKKKLTDLIFNIFLLNDNKIYKYT